MNSTDRYQIDLLRESHLHSGLTGLSIPALTGCLAWVLQ